MSRTYKELKLSKICLHPLYQKLLGNIYFDTQNIDADLINCTILGVIKEGKKYLCINNYKTFIAITKIDQESVFVYEYPDTTNPDKIIIKDIFSEIKKPAILSMEAAAKTIDNINSYNENLLKDLMHENGFYNLRAFHKAYFHVDYSYEKINKLKKIKKIRTVQDEGHTIFIKDKSGNLLKAEANVNKSNQGDYVSICFEDGKLAMFKIYDHKVSICNNLFKVIKCDNYEISISIENKHVIIITDGTSLETYKIYYQIGRSYKSNVTNNQIEIDGKTYRLSSTANKLIVSQTDKPELCHKRNFLLLPDFAYGDQNVPS